MSLKQNQIMHQQEFIQNINRYLYIMIILCKKNPRIHGYITIYKYKRFYYKKNLINNSKVSTRARFTMPK